MSCWRLDRGLQPCEGADMPILSVPDLRQNDSHSCGAVALDVLLRYHGRKLPADVKRLADPVKGLGPDTAELVVRRHLDHVLTGHIDLERLRVLSAFTPVLCVVTLTPEVDHWVCVVGVTRSRVHYHCPTNGVQWLSHAEWDRVWVDCTAGGVWRRYALTGWNAK